MATPSERRAWFREARAAKRQRRHVRVQPARFQLAPDGRCEFRDDQGWRCREDTEPGQRFCQRLRHDRDDQDGGQGIEDRP